jgi:hypothetical protein
MAFIHQALEAALEDSAYPPIREKQTYGGCPAHRTSRTTTCSDAMCPAHGQACAHTRVVQREGRRYHLTEILAGSLEAHGITCPYRGSLEQSTPTERRDHTRSGAILILSPIVTIGLLGALVARYSGTKILVFTWAAGFMQLSIGCFSVLCLVLWWGLHLSMVVSGGRVATMIVYHAIVTWAVFALVCIPLGTLQILGAVARTLYVKRWTSSKDRAGPTRLWHSSR